MDTAQQHSLDSSSSLYKAILDNLPMGGYLFDRSKNLVDIFNFPSKVREKYRLDHFIGKNIMSYVGKKRIASHYIVHRLNEAFNKVLKTGISQQYEHEFKGEYFETTLVPVGDTHIMSYVQNVSYTVKKQQKAERTTRNALLKQKKLILNNANCGLVYLTPDYKVLWENVSVVFKGTLKGEHYKQGTCCYEAFGPEPCENVE